MATRYEQQIDIRVVVDPSKVSEPGAEAVLLERLMKSHRFVQSVVVLRNDGFSRLIPDETTRRNKA
jgi:hypothetical protein